MLRSVVKKAVVNKTTAKISKPSVNVVNTKVTLVSQIEKRKGVGRVLVFRKLGGIGDVLMVLPTLKELKRVFPKIHLGFAIDRHSTGEDVYYQLVKNLPFIDEILDYRYVDTSKWDYHIDLTSVCIRYENSHLPAMNRIDIFSRAAGFYSMDSYLPMYLVTEEEKAWALEYVKKYNGKKVFLHTASMEHKRCWPPHKYKELISQALVDNLNAWFFVMDFNHVGSNWNQFPNVIDISSLPFRKMVAVLSVMDLFIGPDSGPMHLAGTLQIPSIVVFGSIPPLARLNHYPTHEGVRLDKLACIGCWYKPCHNNLKCMTDLDSGLIYGKLRRRLKI